jgi:hypothetical protein
MIDSRKTGAPVDPIRMQLLGNTEHVHSKQTHHTHIAGCGIASRARGTRGAAGDPCRSLWPSDKSGKREKIVEVAPGMHSA